MAYINVAEWSPDQVTDWLKGLDNSMYHYIHSFTNNEVRGQQLLNIRPYELEQLGMYSIGHQEIVLEAVEHLRNFHYHLDKENLQFLALHIATASQCLHNQLARFADTSQIETQILSDVTRTIATIKPLIGWLDRAPFHRINRFVELRNKMLRFAIEMATMAQRDRFVEKPVDQMKQTALRVAKLANYIIQDVSDVMILQPATLNLVTLKKKESELGFNIVPSYHGIHVVTDIKYNSPAHTSGKIEDGDEIVQINYQTVVGWHYKKVIRQLHESQPDILLTLKKRPKHSKIYGQIYMKPYRLPSKKKAPPYRWGGGDGLPSPRVADLLLLPAPPTKRDVAAVAFPMPPVGQTLVVMNSTAPTLPTTAAGLTHAQAMQQAQRKARAAAAAIAASTANGAGPSTAITNGGAAAAGAITTASDSDDCSDIMTPTERKASDKDLRLYLPKPRAVLQRRNTICGDQVSGFKSNVMYWHEYKDGEADSPSLRDKSVSFGFGLEIAARPTTCLGIGQTSGRFSEFGGLKGSLPDVVENGGGARALPRAEHECGAVGGVSAKPQGISKVVRFDSSKKCNEYKDSRYACNVENTILEVFEPIPYVDDEEETIVTLSTQQTQQTPLTNGKGDGCKTPSSIDMRHSDVDVGVTQAVNEVLVRREIEKWEQKTGGSSRLSHDLDIPPAIEPRIEFLHKTPPAPPPRPRKLTVTPFASSSSHLSTSASFHAKPASSLHGAHSATALNPLPATLPKPSPRHLHIAEPLRDHSLHTSTSVPPPPATIVPQPIYNSQQQLQLSESFLQPDPNNDIVEYNNMRSLRGGGDEPSDAAATTDPVVVEALELVTPNKTKNLTLKKKNSIMAKRRNITLKTLEVSDIQGHLYRRTKDKHGVTYWAKLYMVLTDTSLYGFRSKDSDKADCLIFLNGFTVSLATEVHSKPFAFKVYHPSKTFYFAAESQMALAQWIEYIRKATLKGSAAGLDRSGLSAAAGGAALQPVNMRELFSETESSDGEMDFGQVHKILGTPSPIAAGSRFGHKKSFCGSNASNLNAAADDAAGPVPVAKPEKYHLGFGSLKFSWSSSASKAAKAEKKLAASHSDVPVPTAQFRSYRKVPGNAGLQLGTKSMISSPTISLPLTATSPSASAAALSLGSIVSPLDLGMPPSSLNVTPVAALAPLDFVTPARPELATSRSLTQPKQSSVTPLHKHSSSYDADASPTSPIDLIADSFQAARDNQFKPKKLRKNSPHHYIHASNPNLVEFDFPTAKTLDYSFPKVNPSNGWEATAHHHHSNSLQGFVTLKDLMLQKQEEDAKEMYNNRVTLGVEKKLDPLKAAAVAKLLQQQQQAALAQSSSSQSQHGRRSQTSSIASSALASAVISPTTDEASNSQYGGSTTGSERYNKIQSRSLPKTPDYAQSFKPDDSDIIMTRSREGQKLRDFGYEFISGDDTTIGGAIGSKVRSGALHSAAAASSTVATAAVMIGGSAQKKKSGLHWIGGGSGHGSDRRSAVDDDHQRHTAASSTTSSMSSRTGSIKKTKNKLMADTFIESFKTSSEKLFQFKHHPSSASAVTSAFSGRSGSTHQPPEKPHKPSHLPLTLPLNKHNKQPATHVYNMHGQPIQPPSSSSSGAMTPDESLSSVGGGSPFRPMGGSVKKSITYNSSADFAGGVTSPAQQASSVFTKLSFGGSGSSGSAKSSAKEKKLLGSPRLHRALFGQSGRRESDVHSLDHEPFMPMEPKPRAIVHDIADIAPTQLPPPTPHRVPNMGGGGSGFASPEYPNLEYPPVFEAETYSLNDPNASLTLLRRRNNPNNRSK